MSEEDALLRAICEHPDEDTPRLVFADWLSEQGGPVNAAWANGIRAQVWLARGATDVAIAQSSKVFDSNYGREKLYERLGLPEYVSQWERGFPVHATAPFHQLSEAWPRLAFRVPIRWLHVYEVSEEHAAEFVAWPALSVLIELELGAVWEAVPTPEIISFLANCAALRGLKSLILRDALVNEATATVLLDSPHLVGLEALHLSIESTTDALSLALKSRLVARFGSEVFADPIPF